MSWVFSILIVIAILAACIFVPYVIGQILIKKPQDFEEKIIRWLYGALISSVGLMVAFAVFKLIVYIHGCLLN